jgi:tetratricopeptide (TPR) repeat protein
MAIAIAPARARAYGLLAQALRLQGRLDEAAAALDAGTAAAGADPAFAIERGTVLAAAGDTQAAARVWREVLAQDAMNAGAFVRLAALALQGQDMNAAQLLIDSALASPRASAEVLRSALQLMFGTEADGIPRASRLLRLGEKLLECAPHDVGALLVTARAFLALGDRVEASSRLSMIERLEPKSAAAAEVQAMRLAMDNPGADLEIQSVLRAAHSVVPERLADVSARARRLATLHGAWGGWLAAAVADRRRSRPAAARNALEVALEAAPVASLLHLELAAVLIDLGDPLGAVSHAQSALAFEGPSYRALLMSARAFHAAGRSVEAAQAARAVLQLQPGDAAALGLLAHRAPSKPKRSWVEELRRAFARLRVSGT